MATDGGSDPATNLNSVCEVWDSIHVSVIEAQLDIYRNLTLVYGYQSES
jgi:hypothetical protein